MFKVYENKNYLNGVEDGGGDWVMVGAYHTFDVAHSHAQDICKDIANEGGKDSIYWFSDNYSKEQGYRVCIDSENFLSKHN